jgi:hypothetical protein
VTSTLLPKPVTIEFSQREGTVTLKTVIQLMCIVGVVLVGFTLGLHEKIIHADEAQVRAACRQVCKLGVLHEANADPSSLLGNLAASLSGHACDAIDENTPFLDGCRERLTHANISVSDYRCIVTAKTMPEAQQCHESL